MSEVRRIKRQKTKGLAFSSTQKPRFEGPPKVDSKQRYFHPPSITETVKTRILLLSDTHGNSKLPEEVSLENQKN